MRAREGRIVVSPPHLRRGSRVLEDGSKELHALAQRVREHALPPMPRELTVRVAAEAAAVAGRLESSWSPISTHARELRVRALWAEIADARAHERKLTDAQLREVFALMKDGSLLRWASDAQSRWAGRMLGRTYREQYQDPAKLLELAALLRTNGKNADFLGGFVDRFGTANLAEIPRIIQAMANASQLAGAAQPAGSPVRADVAAALLAGQPGYRYGGDPVRDLLAPFAQALAVATSSGTLSRDRQRELAGDSDRWAVAQLLADDGRYGKGFLLDLFRNDVVERIVAENRGDAPAADDGPPLGGLPADPKVLVLDALSHNHDAAAAAFTRELPELELRRADGTAATVSDPVQLLLEFGTYGDEGRALGEASASAVDGLHDDDEHRAADRISNRLLHEVVSGREELGAIRDGVARTVASEAVMDDLHRIAAGDEGRKGIDLSGAQVRELLGELSERDVARERLLDGVARHQEGELREPDGGRVHADEIAAFNRLLVEGVNESRLEDLARPPEVTPPVSAPPAQVAPPEQAPPAPSGPVAPVPAEPPLAPAPAEASAPEPAPPPFAGDAEAQAWLDDAQADLAAPVEAPLDWDSEQAEEMRARLHVAIVGGYFESGDLGTKEEIRAEIRRLPDTEGFEPKPFFDRFGHILGYDAMDTDQRLTFEAWLETDRVQAVVHEAIEAAETGLDARLS